MLKPGLVRLLLATLVVLFHITKFVFLGSLAVFCFFILSGYWVSFMYENKYSHMKNPIRVFYISRLFRILPVFYLITICTFILISIYTPTELNKVQFLNLGGFLFWLSNIFLIGYNQLPFRPLVPAWSLDIEMQFYLLLPFLLLLMKTKWNRTVCIGFSFLIALILMLFYKSSFGSETILQYLIFFLIGIAIFKSGIIIKKRIELLFNILFLLVVILHYCVPYLFNIAGNSEGNYNLFLNFYLSFLLIPFLSNSVLRKSDKLDMIFGGMSYTLYLSHWMFILPYNYYIRDISKIERIPYTLFYLFATYLFAYYVFIYFDKPLDKIRKSRVENEGSKKLSY